MEFRNGVPMRRDRNKPDGLSGKSKNELYACPEAWGGEDYLLPIDRTIVRQLKEMMGGDQLIAFVSEEYSTQADAAYRQLNCPVLTPSTIWTTFRDMYSLLYS